ncbi:MAG: amino acid aminotransferase [Verrucomicrobiota bacterium]|nr:amino acid aminotransferase [Verrucomicrobiota bacterium]
MALFNTVAQAPADPILGLNEAFLKDPRTNKINLGVGVFKDASGKTPVLNSVKKAEARILEAEQTKNYLPIDGSPAYNARVLELLFGADSAVTKAGRAVSAHTPGGTGGLRVAADFIKRNNVAKKVWISDPTWPNHPQIFQAAGLDTGTYRYFDASANALDFAGMQSAIEQIPSGDVLLVHGCCHNPTGADPTATQWAAIAEVAKTRNLLVLIDYAYQGFGSGLREDAICLEAFTQAGVEFLVASSFSKNFGLYNERVGAVTAVSNDAETASRVLSQIKAVVRANYSNPSSHGGSIVSTILNDAALRTEWESELTAMRNRINGMRTDLVANLKARGAKRDFSFIAQQKGMFSFSGLTKEQVARIRDEYAIYIVGSGRINVAGLTPANIDRCCEAIVAVL